MEAEFNFDLTKLQDATNINDLLTEEQSSEIGREVFRGYEIDKQSRQPWEEKMREATELALQIVQDKSYPWPNASNVKFPLLTIASLQFASRAYPALVKAPDLVKYRVQGKDQDGQKAARAQRISTHMSYQLLDEDEGWEPDQDRAFLALPILGCIFKKSYYESVKEHNCSRLVLPKNLVVHYYTRSIEECERKTEIFELYEREIKERQLRKIFSEIEDLGPAKVTDAKEEDKRQGLIPPGDDKSRPRTLLEQHCYFDLDGDGYKEPYVATIDESSQKVFRIVNRFKKITTEQSVKIKENQSRIQALAEGVQPPEEGVEPTFEQTAQAKRVEATILGLQEEVKRLAAEPPKVLKIEPVEHYTKYPFIPSPDGGFYDLGFGALLGPLNDSVNTLINQLIDAGSMQNGSCGFIGKGARIQGGRLRFSPNEWKRVNVSGSALKESIVPLPLNQPSEVLFNLLSLLINYSERVASVNDAMMGDNPGQNTPAYNMSAMLEQGLQVFNGIFKRVYRSFRSELRKIFDLNAVYLDQEVYFEYQDEQNRAVRADYTADSKDLIPAADPNAFSNKEKLMKAQALAERSAMTAGYDPIIVEKRLLEALDIPDAAEVYPLVPETDEQGNETGRMTLKFPPQIDPELEIKKADMQRRTLEGKARAEKDFMLASAQIAVAEATIIKTYAEAKKVADEPEIKRIELLLDELQSQRESLVEMAKIEDNAKERAAKRVERKPSNAGA
jgi:chaperonin GroES